VSTPPPSGVASGLRRQYVHIWDGVPTAQYTPPAPSGWYLSNPVPAVQISPYHMLYPWPQPLPPCNYCGATQGTTPLTNARTLSLACTAPMITLGPPVPPHTNHAILSSASSPKTIEILSWVEEPIHTGNAPGQGPSSTVTNVLVAQCLKRRE
jgi:hypothetical protein